MHRQSHIPHIHTQRNVAADSESTRWSSVLRLAHFDAELLKTHKLSFGTKSPKYKISQINVVERLLYVLLPVQLSMSYLLVWNLSVSKNLHV